MLKELSEIDYIHDELHDIFHIELSLRRELEKKESVFKRERLINLNQRLVKRTNDLIDKVFTKLLLKEKVNELSNRPIVEDHEGCSKNGSKTGN